jgi:hypothetical protein
MYIEYIVAQQQGIKAGLAVSFVVRNLPEMTGVLPAIFLFIEVSADLPDKINRIP